MFFKPRRIKSSEISFGSGARLVVSCGHCIHYSNDNRFSRKRESVVESCVNTMLLHNNFQKGFVYKYI